MPDSVTTIGACAFYYCENLTEIVVPASVVNFEGDESFFYCHPDLTIVTPKGSAAEAYAIEYGIKYRNE